MSLSELSCAEAAADGASPSESSELRSRIGATDAMGSEPVLSLLSTMVVLMVDALSVFCFFFGRGSSVDEVLCFDLTGTGIVGRAVTCSGSVRAAMAGAGELPESGMGIGVVNSTRGLGARSVSRGCGG